MTETHPSSAASLTVASRPDVRRAGDLATRFAASLGFPAQQCDEVGLAVTELASNLVRHAAHGTIKLSSIATPGRIGIRIESEDGGPGIADFEEAVKDGYSTAGGPGLGLGTVNRLMDELEVYSRTGAGLLIVCQLWARPKTAAVPNEIAFGVATRSCRMLPENGDAFVIKQWAGCALAGVIDGLGHGPLAQQASQTARRYIEQHFDRPLESIFRGADRACRATRGVVMALARFDLHKQTITVGSIGNIETRLAGGSGRHDLVVRRGVVGLNAPTPACAEAPWTPATILIMHSDGLRANWDWREFSNTANERLGSIAQQLLRSFGRIEDDATVLVARNAS